MFGNYVYGVYDVNNQPEQNFTALLNPNQYNSSVDATGRLLGLVFTHNWLNYFMIIHHLYQKMFINLLFLSL